jgi:hypothetical protein
VLEEQVLKKKVQGSNARMLLLPPNPPKNLHPTKKAKVWKNAFCFFHGVPLPPKKNHLYITAFFPIQVKAMEEKEKTIIKGREHPEKKQKKLCRKPEWVRFLKELAFTTYVYFP